MDEYDFKKTLECFDAGIFEKKLSKAVRDVCAAVAYHGDRGKKGRVVMDLTVERIGDSLQVNVQHKLVTSQPTARGKLSEENTTSTPLHVTRHGPSFVPDSEQRDAFMSNQEGDRHGT